MVNLTFWLRRPKLILPRLKFWLFERFNLDKPWLCTGTIEYLDLALTGTGKGVEFGSGRSTQWLAKRLKQLVSVEHHEGWHSIVTKQLQDAKIANVDYRLIPLDHLKSAPEEADYQPLPKYVSFLEDFGADTLDFVLVDGHYRTTCIRQSIAKIAPGGFLVVDDVNLWANNNPPVPADWNCVNTSSNGIKTAKIWQKSVNLAK